MSKSWFRSRAGSGSPRVAALARSLHFTGALDVANTHRLTHRGRVVLNFSTNDYLSIGESNAVRTAGAEALLHYGASTGASRLLSGEYELHLELEREIAEFLGAEAALTFVSGHATNVTVIGTLFGRNDIVLHDQYAHNSMIEGIRLSGARRIAFRHNDVDDLEHRLESLPLHTGAVVVCVDGVYSMHGDLAPLRLLIEAKHRHGFVLYVDDAHAVGTIGNRGAGSADHAEIDPRQIDLVMGTLGKALGSCGGFIVGDADLIERLRWTAPGFVFSAGVPAPQAAAALAAIRLLRTHPQWVRELEGLAQSFRVRLAEAMDLDRTSDPTPIVPVPVSAERVLGIASELNTAGIRVFPIVPPAVPPASSRLRFSVNRLHSAEELTATADAVRRAVLPTAA